ncbi:DUF4424 domain-containing protein [Paraburkholderia sp. D15]|uniref:DUF4424 family protein n=1 Tax=Paraburkholderia sp. D15 TaxID=2880218 RepID=UPI00247A62B1|nr:DUF4424 family protein [Paraburkholderia sp. D15]WGS48096.1 DUF4424 domain-containing protein [Paraburkholderia sp. D15]
MKIRPLLASVVFAASISAFANDGIGGVDTGNITLGHTDKVAMAKEVLDIAPDRISVDYEFLNESANDVHESLIFPLPPYGADASQEPGYWGQPHGFRILVDGESKSFSTHVSARFKGKDITAQLHALGLTDRQIALLPGEGAPFDVTAKPFTPAQMNAMRQRGWLEAGAQSDSIPAWEVSVAYVWYLTFPAGKVVRVHHEYRPFPTVGIPTIDMHPSELREQACADNAFLSDWKKVSQPTADDARQTNGLFVGYILKTANTWKDGSRDFTLRLHRPTPAGLISTCFEGKGQYTDPLTLSWHLNDFHPRRDLSIYFGNIPEQDSDKSEKRVPPVLPGE